jgi:hypothetical protein
VRPAKSSPNILFKETCGEPAMWSIDTALTRKRPA